MVRELNVGECQMVHGLPKSRSRSKSVFEARPRVHGTPLARLEDKSFVKCNSCSPGICMLYVLQRRTTDGKQESRKWTWKWKWLVGKRESSSTNIMPWKFRNWTLITLVHNMLGLHVSTVAATTTIA
jgi:hypothetical protein